MVFTGQASIIYGLLLFQVNHFPSQQLILQALAFSSGKQQITLTHQFQLIFIVK
jgi:hypothetical protein